MNCKLRPLLESDIWILHKWINDPEIIQFTSTFRPISEMEQKEWFNNTSYFKNNYVFGIELLEDERLIGTCGLYDFDTIAHKIELRIKICDSTLRGKGIGFEALTQLLDFGFNELNLNKIWLRVIQSNLPAVKLYEKSGFKTDGIMRQDMFLKGKYQDILMMSLLKSERV